MTLAGPRLAHIWALLILVAAFIGPASSPIVAPDSFWSLRRGAWMVEHGALLSSDPFTSAPPVAGQAVNVQWLADLLFHSLERLGGLELVIVGTAVAIVAAYGLALRAAFESSGRLRASCLAVVLAYVLGAANLAPRPQTMAYPLFGLFLAVLWRSDRRLLWLLPLVTAVWANVHGSFFVGVLLLACFTVGRPTRAHLMTLGACGLAMLISPYGLGALGYLAALGTNPIIRDHVPEWAPTTIGTPTGVALFAIVAGMSGVALASRTRLTRNEVIVLLVFGALALWSLRAVVWFGLAATPIAARLLAGLTSATAQPTRERPVLNLALALALVVVAGVSLPWFKHTVPGLPTDKVGVIGQDQPVQVAAFLQTAAPPSSGRMFNYERWGGYFDWAVWPRHQAFVDGRFELHPPSVWFDYLAIVRPSQRWRGLLDEYDVSYAVLSQAEQQELIALLRLEPDWRVVYEDWQAVVLTRR